MKKENLQDKNNQRYCIFNDVSNFRQYVEF